MLLFSTTAVICPPIPLMEHALTNATDRSYKSNITYTCLNGYIWEGANDQSILCQADGTWSAPQGCCKRMYYGWFAYNTM